MDTSKNSIENIFSVEEKQLLIDELNAENPGKGKVKLLETNVKLINRISDSIFTLIVTVDRNSKISTKLQYVIIFFTIVIAISNFFVALSNYNQNNTDDLNYSGNNYLTYQSINDSTCQLVISMPFELINSNIYLINYQHHDTVFVFSGSVPSHTHMKFTVRNNLLSLVSKQNIIWTKILIEAEDIHILTELNNILLK